MKTLVMSLVCAFALDGSPAAYAQTKPDTAAPSQHAHATATASAFDVPGIAQPAVSVVDDFARALAAGDLSTVETLLDADVLILESGGAERSREQYLGHHAISDARFLKGSQRKITWRKARIAGDMAWVASESDIRVVKDGKALALLSTETMVLRRDPAGWRIAHIHWSSRPHKGNGETP